MVASLRTTPSLLAAAIALSLSGMAQADVGSLGDALAQGQSKLDLRYRYEFVDQDGNLDEGQASTLRTRLTYDTATFRGLSGRLEFDNVTEVLQDNYNDLSGDPERQRYAVVADPEYTEVNQAYLDYAAPAKTLLRVGRQRINLDNQRFVGGVGWRQNEQTYDAVAIVNQALPQTTITLANVTNVNTILGGDISGEDHQVIHVHNATIPLANVSAYGYLLNDISDTYGARLSGDADTKPVKFGYALEYATQNTDDAGTDLDTTYWHANLSAGAKLAKVTLGYEVLGSDDGQGAFQTPLGTKHKFNGWADKFLTTPNDGLVDTYVTVASAALGPKVALSYHQFDADEGSANYGDELDLAISTTFGDRYSGLLKFAHYNADEYATDTDKVWLQLGASF
ncbi:alginate export family protein [Marinobacteraceae bacterium S3BR75-40.1]